MPTRGRPHFVEKAIKSIVDNSHSLQNFELLFAIDEDDKETAENISLYLKQYSEINYKIIFSERLYYSGFHIYMKKLSEQANGKLLWLFPDDVTITTKDWDLVIEKFKNFLYLKINLGETYSSWEYSLVPIISKDWVNVTGRIAENSQTDCWLGDTARDLNIITEVPINCKLCYPSDGQQHNISHYLSQEIQKERQKDVEKLRKFIMEKDEKFK